MSTHKYTIVHESPITPDWVRTVGNRKLTRVDLATIRLGHESLDVTPAYLKSKDAESEEAHEHETAAARTGDEVQVARTR